MSPSAAELELLTRHAPELRFHRIEPYRADSPRLLTDGFTPNAYSNDLRNRDSGAVLARSRPVGRGAALSLDLLTGEGQRYYPGGPIVSKDDYLAAHDATIQDDALRYREHLGWANKTYARVARGREGRTWLQYWFFYYHNPFRAWRIGVHQGDWEMIQIAVVDGVPQLVTYAQHDEGERRPWSEVAKREDDPAVPIVYVAKFSHASYFEPGTHRRLWIALGRANDHTEDGARERPEVHILDERRDRWLKWPGRWGRTWGPIDKSPEGPAFQGPWKDPEHFHFQVAEPRKAPTRGLEAEVQPVLPPAPALTARVEDGVLVVDYAFDPAATVDDSAPVRLELAAYGASGPPVTRSYDITSLTATVLHPLPPDGVVARVEAAVYDEDDEERLLTVPVGTTRALEGGFTPDAPSPPPVAAPLEVPAGTLRILARAPADEPDPVGAFTALLATITPDLGPWSVAPLFAPPRPGEDPEPARWVVAAGEAPLPAGTDLAAAAFAAAERLRAPGWEIDPDVPSSVVVVDPETAEATEVVADRLWALDAIRAPAAWELRRDGGRAQGEGVFVAQPDTGFTDHPELQLGALDRLRDRNVITGVDDAHAVLLGFPPFAFPSHGTGTASVVVSREPGDVTGSAPRAVVVPIRAAATVVHVHNGHLAAAVDYARHLDVGVITISMGGIAYPRALRLAIQLAVRQGIIVMAAAGQPLPLVVAPASYPECLAVAGTTQDDEPWTLSARGREVDWCAPALKVPVAETSNDGVYGIGAHSGTSFSVALSAGVAALWLAHHGGQAKVREAVGAENVQAVFRALAQATARVPDGWDTEHWGAGIIDAAALLAADLPAAPPAAVTPAPEPPEDWAAARLAGLLEVDEATARRQLLAIAPADADARARHAGEIVYRVAEDAGLRSALRPTRALESGSGDARMLLAAVASPGLREALG